MPTRTGKKKPKSRAQARLMFAAAAGKVPGVSRSVGKEFVRGMHGRKMKSLPKKVRRKSSR